MTAVLETPRVTLVLLPGLDGTDAFFAPLLAHLPAWIEPLVVTYPGTGPNSYEDLLPRVLDAVPTSDRFAVLGWSFGGPLALRVAHQRSTSVTAVVLCSSFVTAPKPALAPLRAGVRTPVVWALRTARRVGLWLRADVSPDLRRAKALTWQRVGARTLAARSRAALGVDARPELVACTAPLMYLVASEDTVISRRALAEVVRLAPRTRVSEVDGPHLALFTNPGACAERIADFLAGAPGVARDGDR